MKTKSETMTHLTNFIAYIETQFLIKLKTLRSDNGNEFFMQDLFLTKEIINQQSCVESPQQNDFVERKDQPILNVARALSFQTSVPLNFWHFSVIHANSLTASPLTFYSSNRLMSFYINKPQSLFTLKHLVAFPLHRIFNPMEQNSFLELGKPSS